MGIAAYNRGSRAISDHITQQLKARSTLPMIRVDERKLKLNEEFKKMTEPPTPKLPEVGIVVFAPKCHHTEAECKLTNRSWNSFRWCDECRRWFWFGDKDHRNAE